MRLRPARAGDDGGQILILAAVSMTVLFGIAALSIDASYMYDKRNRLYAAADAAAKSAAIEVQRNASVTLSNLQDFADQQVAAHGFSPGSPTSVVVHWPPTSGPFTGSTTHVEVIVSEPTSTFFGVVLGWTSMTPGARAVAGASPGLNCIITLSSDATSLDIGNSTLTMPGCSVADNGGLNTANPNTTIDARSIGLTGTCAGQACPQANQQTGVPPTLDPFANLAMPAVGSPCPDVSISGGPLASGCYHNITVANNQAISLSGTYVITGRFRMGNSGTLNGSGVLIYFAGSSVAGPCSGAVTAGCFDAGNGTTFNLTAQTSGAYRGILFIADPANHLNFAFDNQVDWNVSGALYMPGTAVSFRNTVDVTNDCALFVSASLFIRNGCGTFSNACTAFGGSPILTVSIGE
jgi:Flp pilus assembly protein TadG